MSEARNPGRIFAASLVLLLMLCGLAYRLVYLHICSGSARRAEIEGMSQTKRVISVARGRIYDRCGRDNVLAMDIRLKNIIADPETIIKSDTVDTAVSSLSSALGEDPSRILSLLDNPGRHYVPVRRLASEAESARVEAMKLKGIYFEDAGARYYPKNDMMCHVVGFMNQEGVGSSGIEMTRNSLLRGTPGYVETIVDGRRRELYDRRISEVPPVEGADVLLCVDLNMQYAVETALDSVMRESGAVGAWAIVESVRTGEILAMASRPAYDLNKFPESSPDQRLNRAIGVVYEPGSTLKAVTIAGILEEGLVTPSNIIDCENGAWSYAGRILRDYHPYGRLNVAEVLQKSSNIGTAKLALKLGDQRLHGYLERFGFGGKLKVDLPGEEAGILHSTRNWSALSCSRIGIGQGIAVTALQMLNAVCAIANDGVLMQPHVVKRVVAKGGRVLYEGSPRELGRAISPQTAAVMRELMGAVTEEGGTGTRASIPGYTVAGKTGTAQKPVAGGYSETKFVASFVGFLPVENPEIGIIVVVDEPSAKSHFGGTIAAPAFSEIAAHAVRYLNIPPSCAAGTALASNN